MKYALESLPELIGDDDYKDLCLMFGWHEVHDTKLDGRSFARHVREKALTRRLARASQEIRTLSAIEPSPNQPEVSK